MNAIIKSIQFVRSLFSGFRIEKMNLKENECVIPFFGDKYYRITNIN